jgi:hypothetical protein
VKLDNSYTSGVSTSGCNCGEIRKTKQLASIPWNSLEFPTYFSYSYYYAYGVSNDLLAKKAEVRENY